MYISRNSVHKTWLKTLLKCFALDTLCSKLRKTFENVSRPEFSLDNPTFNLPSLQKGAVFFCYMIFSCQERKWNLVNWLKIFQSTIMIFYLQSKATTWWEIFCQKLIGNLLSNIDWKYWPINNKRLIKTSNQWLTGNFPHHFFS